MEPNEREKELADEILEELDKHIQSATGHILGAGFEPYLLSKLATYRAELRPEPTAGDREAAEELYRYIVGPAPEDLGLPYSSQGPVNKIADALSAARGNRAELEAATREFFEAEELEYAAETRTCPKATIGEINEARDRRKAAHDALATILEVKA